MSQGRHFGASSSWKFWDLACFLRRGDRDYPQQGSRERWKRLPKRIPPILPCGNWERGPPRRSEVVLKRGIQKRGLTGCVVSAQGSRWCLLLVACSNLVIKPYLHMRATGSNLLPLTKKQFPSPNNLRSSPAGMLLVVSRRRPSVISDAQSIADQTPSVLVLGIEETLGAGGSEENCSGACTNHL